MAGLRPQQFGRERKILPDPDFKKHKLPYSHFRNDLMYRNAMPNHLNYLDSEEELLLNPQIRKKFKKALHNTRQVQEEQIVVNLFN